jgi:hypothetical protein
VPDIRRRLLLALHGTGWVKRAQLITTTGIPDSSARRALEDLALLRLVDAEKQGGSDNAAWSYRLSEEALLDWPDCLPEVSGHRHSRCSEGLYYLPNTVYDDFSGRQA